MTEDEWQTATNPNMMIVYLTSPTPQRSDRKLTLFALACVDRIRPFIQDQRFLETLAIEERMADGLASPKECVRAADLARKTERAARRRFRQMYDGRQPTHEELRAFFADKVAYSFVYAPWMLARCVATEVKSFVQTVGDSEAEEDTRQCLLLREIFGNPFRPVAVDPNWLTSAVVGLARGILEERAFERLPILADALEEAGCQESAILTHCRSSGPHVPGCWVIDLLLEPR